MNLKAPPVYPFEVLKRPFFFYSLQNEEQRSLSVGFEDCSFFNLQPQPAMDESATISKGGNHPS